MGCYPTKAKSKNQVTVKVKNSSEHLTTEENAQSSRSTQLDSIEIYPLSNSGTRKSIQTLWKNYKKGQTKELEDLVEAFHLIQEKNPSDPYSFFVVAGLHGEPLTLREEIENLKQAEDKYVYWGGYCHHGNVLFPIWHRAYLMHLENSLQKAVPTAHMAYWDELDNKPLPEIFIQDNFTFSSGRVIKNPLKSYVFQRGMEDFPGQTNYSKPKGYETVRYPYSGLVGTPEAKKQSDLHNSQYPPDKANQLLRKNIRAWQEGPQPKSSGDKTGTDIMFEKCLNAPNYTVFSNTTSASAYNMTHKMDENTDVVYPIESPHNDMHLAIGGFDMDGSQDGQVQGANGDMGENNTAGFDPIFFFHHAFIDYMFWQWQKKHNSTTSIEIISGYPGTSAFDSQGPTPGYAPNESLNVNSQLFPFAKDRTKYWIAKELADIQSWGYDYEETSKTINKRKARVEEVARRDKSSYLSKKFSINSFNRRKVAGSSILVAYATKISDPSQKFLVGYQSILSRWNIDGCANCQTHLEISCVFQPFSIPRSLENDIEYQVELITHSGRERIMIHG